MGDIATDFKELWVSTIMEKLSSYYNTVESTCYDRVILTVLWKNGRVVPNHKERGRSEEGREVFWVELTSCSWTVNDEGHAHRHFHHWVCTVNYYLFNIHLSIKYLKGWNWPTLYSLRAVIFLRDKMQQILK